MQAREHIVSVRMNDEEYARFQAKATSVKVSQAQYMREAILDGLARGDIQQLIEQRMGSYMEAIAVLNEERLSAIVQNMAQFVTTENGKLLVMLFELSGKKT